MKQKLVLKVKLDGYRCIYRKSCVLAMMNIVLGMNHWVRKQLHDDMQKDFVEIITSAYKKNPFGYNPMDQYRVSIGYYRGINISGKKTKTIDADGLSYIGKVAIDSLIKVTPIPNDSIFVIPEFRCVYLGERAEEEIWLQLTKDEYEVDGSGSVGTLGSEEEVQNS